MCHKWLVITSNLQEFARTYLFTFYKRILIYAATVSFVYRHSLLGAGFHLFSPLDLSKLFISNGEDVVMWSLWLKLAAVMKRGDDDVWLLVWACLCTLWSVCVYVCLVRLSTALVDACHHVAMLLLMSVTTLVQARHISSSQTLTLHITFAHHSRIWSSSSAPTHLISTFFLSHIALAMLW